MKEVREPLHHHPTASDNGAVLALPADKSLAYTAPLLESPQQRADGLLGESMLGREISVDLGDGRAAAPPENAEDRELEIGEVGVGGHGRNLRRSPRTRQPLRRHMMSNNCWSYTPPVTGARMAPVIRRILALALVTTPLASPLAAQRPASPDVLHVDPLLVATVGEYRNVLRTLGPSLFPGWTDDAVPILLYRPGVQDVLIGAPRVPKGFRVARGAAFPPGERVLLRDDSTAFDLDDQNTTTELDSMKVLVVADPYSRMRNQLIGIIGRPEAMRAEWFAKWNFIPSPYSDLRLMLHEAFHVYQERLAPDRNADESAIATYPVLDPVNNALTALEAQLLRAAILADAPAERQRRVAQFVAARRERRARLDSSAASYEDLNEFKEGLGRYVELRFMQRSAQVTPIAAMWMKPGFAGYGAPLRAEFVKEADELVRVASNADDRFGNKYGGGPVRFRLYYLGAAIGLALDEAVPDWKRRVFAEGISLGALLDGSVRSPLPILAALLDSAKREFRFDTTLAGMERLARDGRRVVQARVDSIERTTGTLVTIDYSAIGERLGMSYTPFGVTGIREGAAIYDLVPIMARFSNRVLLTMKATRAVIVDRTAKRLTFAINTKSTEVVAGADGAIDVGEFSLSASSATVVSTSGNHVIIRLK